MRDAETERAAVVAVRRDWRAREVALAVFIALSLSQIGYQLHGIKHAIRTHTSFALCVELAKLGGGHPACDHLTGEPTEDSK